MIAITWKLLLRLVASPWAFRNLLELSHSRAQPTLWALGLASGLPKLSCLQNIGYPRAVETAEVPDCSRFGLGFKMSTAGRPAQGWGPPAKRRASTSLMRSEVL